MASPFLFFFLVEGGDRIGMALRSDVLSMKVTSFLLSIDLSLFVGVEMALMLDRRSFFLALMGVLRPENK